LKAPAEIERLIIRQLSGLASAADISRLDSWRTQSQENETSYREYQVAWEQLPGMISYKPAWEEFRNRHFGLRRKRSSGLVVMQYAAAAILVLGLFITGYYFSGSDIYHTGEGEARNIGLSDGTIVHLFPGSELAVPRTYGWRSRRLSFKGKAGFDVERNEKKPFGITSDNTGVRVLGTAFILEDRLGMSSLEVAEGKVAYWLLAAADTLILTEGEKGSLVEGRLRRSEISSSHNSWLTGDFNFNNERLVEVIRRLQEHYGFRLISNKLLESRECRFTGDFSGQSLENILEELSLTMNFKYEYRDGVLEIVEINCL
jgi:transmembrane sensor